MKRVSLVLRKEIPFPEIPCAFKWHANLPKTPSQKTNQKKKKMVCILMKNSPQFLPTYGHVWM